MVWLCQTRYGSIICWFLFYFFPARPPPPLCWSSEILSLVMWSSLDSVVLSARLWDSTSSRCRRERSLEISSFRSSEPLILKWQIAFCSYCFWYEIFAVCFVGWKRCDCWCCEQLWYTTMMYHMQIRSKLPVGYEQSRHWTSDGRNYAAPLRVSKTKHTCTLSVNL